MRDMCAGKDRTGIIVMLILMLCGVESSVRPPSRIPVLWLWQEAADTSCMTSDGYGILIPVS